MIFSSKYKSAFFAILLFLIGCSGAYQASSLKDTAVVRFVSPDSITERAVFSDTKLQYDFNTKYEPGLLQRFLEWISKVLFGDVEYKNISFTRQMIIWLVVLLFLALAFRILYKSGFTKLVKSSSKPTGFSFTELKDGLYAINFEKAINDAVLVGDWRSAIRWQYLRSLHMLEKKGLLEFLPAKTNFDYLNELRKTKLQEGFSGLSKIFEYVWYGKFLIDQKAYMEYSELFNRYNKQIDV